MAPKSVVDHLAELPEEALAAMLNTARAELARLTVEVAQLEEAVARKQRRGRTGGGSITREQVLDAARSVFSPFAATDIQQALAEQGREASVNAIRNHLNRLVERGSLVKTEDGYGFPPSTDDDELPF